MKLKTELVVALLSANAVTQLNAQGYITFNNLPPASGLVYIASETPGGLLLNQDINLQLLGGPTPFSLQPIHKWLLSDGSADGINASPGRFSAPTNSTLEIPGVQPGEVAYLTVLAWTGNFDAWEATASHGIASFANPTGAFDSAPGLTGMPSFIIGIPEPSALALVGLGGSLLVGVRKRRLRL